MTLRLEAVPSLCVALAWCVGLMLESTGCSPPRPAAQVTQVAGSASPPAPSAAPTEAGSAPAAEASSATPIPFELEPVLVLPNQAPLLLAGGSLYRPKTGD